MSVPSEGAGSGDGLGDTPGSARFLTLEQVAKVLSTSQSQVYALVRHKQLRAIKIGGRGQWRVEASALENYITRLYAETEQWIDSHPFTGPTDLEADPDADPDLDGELGGG